uniref:Uncharacterized protein n=1 Tax=Paramormyrops kingsleyae TaxID=1676925 RepID=A0A3B3S2Z3_9TELE
MCTTVMVLTTLAIILRRRFFNQDLVSSNQLTVTLYSTHSLKQNPSQDFYFLGGVPQCRISQLAGLT